MRVAEDALDANTTIAHANRADFDRAGVRVVNLMSAPGAGKTTLLERDARGRAGRRARRACSRATCRASFDADRLSALHVPVTQLNTDRGFGGECHLDANMVRSALPALPLDDIDLLMIENVGNLVCPAEFRVGEDAKAMVCSVTEGEDKPLKYPLMFRTCELVVVNKIDLLPHLDFDLDRLLANLDAVNPGVRTVLVSARTGEGVEEVARGWRARRPAGPTAGVTAGRQPWRAGWTRCWLAARRPREASSPPRRSASRRAVPPDGRALRRRRPAGGVGLLAAGALGRPPRGRGVRAPGDRGQACAAGARSVAARAARCRRRWSWRWSRGDIAIGFGGRRRRLAERCARCGRSPGR